MFRSSSHTEGNVGPAKAAEKALDCEISPYHGEPHAFRGVATWTRLAPFATFLDIVGNYVRNRVCTH